MNSVFMNITNNKSVRSVLLISEDLEYVQKLRKFLNDKFNLSFFMNGKFQLLDTQIDNFDLIVFDNSDNKISKFTETLKLKKTYNFNIPMIVLENETSEELSNYKYDNMYTILDKNINEAFLFKNIEIALDFLYTNKKLQFENGFYFDMNRELLFQGKKTIKLTKTEKKLINLLALNPNVLVTYEHISSVVWKGKEFSIYSLRNVIKHIREKTDETFIKNSSNKGYVINTI
jgi:two-component system response regulator MprA